MAVTNYISCGGLLIGEVGQASFLTYHGDSDGSVTMTVDQSGAIQNSYVYKPFGAVLAKGGLAADPRFMFKGTLGWSNTQRAHSEFAMPSAHQSSLDGRQTTRWALMGSAYVLDKEGGQVAVGEKVPTFQPDYSEGNSSSPPPGQISPPPGCSPASISIVNKENVPAQIRIDSSGMFALINLSGHILFNCDTLCSCQPCPAPIPGIRNWRSGYYNSTFDDQWTDDFPLDCGSPFCLEFSDGAWVIVEGEDSPGIGANLRIPGTCDRTYTATKIAADSFPREYNKIFQTWCSVPPPVGGKTPNGQSMVAWGYRVKVDSWSDLKSGIVTRGFTS